MQTFLFDPISAEFRIFSRFVWGKRIRGALTVGEQGKDTRGISETSHQVAAILDILPLRIYEDRLVLGGLT